jgi:mannose-6-phosphate isomerase-like protein (cupin superfamily)
MIYSFLKNGTIAMYIDESGKDYEIDLMTVDYYIAQEKYTVKVEGLEKHFKEQYATHCYISPKGAPSFPLHLDPCDVTIKCIEGEKTMIIDDKKVVIKEGQEVMIPANTPHQATNESDSVILSIGQ